MKILKTILFVIIGLVVTGAILVLVAPNDFRVQKSVVVDVPKPLVFKHIKLLEKQHAWNPWNAYDPDLVVSFSGEEDGTFKAHVSTQTRASSEFPKIQTPRMVFSEKS